MTRCFGEEDGGEDWFTRLELGGSFPRGSANLIPFMFTDTPMVGKHNLENILLATTTARLLGVPDEIIASTVRSFHGVAHRLEEVAVVNGVRYINDATSTTPVAGRVALAAFDGPIVLVVGGNTKFLPLEDWPEAIVSQCRDVILLKGTGTDELLPALQDAAQKLGITSPVHGVFDDFTAAMNVAVSFPHPGVLLVFSPACTSVALFHNDF